MNELAGRPVYTRADLTARHNIGLSTLEGLYRDRATTGHPEAVGKIGRSLAWDADQWDTWYTTWTDTTGLATLDQLADLIGRSKSSVSRLWDQHAVNGHPQPIKKLGKTYYWNAEKYRLWFENDYQAADPSDRASQVDYGGHPDDQLTLSEFARVLGIPENTAVTYARRPPAGWPEPAEAETLPSGRVRRRYTRQQAWDYARNHLARRHPGGGRPAGPTTPRTHPYQGDPRLQIAREALTTVNPDDRGTLAKHLAQQHGGAPGTWASILTTARQYPAPAEF